MKCGAAHFGGSTLMLSLWALVVLAAVVLAWAGWVSQGIDVAGEANRALEARALAHSGMAVALHPGIGRNSPHLAAEFPNQKSYRVSMESEGAKLNLNYFLMGADARKIDYFKRFLAFRGLNAQERDLFVDCLLDWISPATGIRRMNSVPESPTYRLPHRPLESLDEVALVAGSAPLVSRAGWKEELTIYSSGPLDLESVSAELLALVPGIGEQRARRFVAAREECQKQGRSKEGYPFKNLAEALMCLGLSSQQFEQLRGILGFRDPVTRIQSKGCSAKVVRQTDVIVRKVRGANAQILLWSEK